ncbi:MAG: hypothetical protein V4451_17015 [Pseudomonadota bacterium]
MTNALISVDRRHSLGTVPASDSRAWTVELDLNEKEPLIAFTRPGCPAYRYTMAGLLSRRIHQPDALYLDSGADLCIDAAHIETMLDAALLRVPMLEGTFRVTWTPTDDPDLPF